MSSYAQVLEYDTYITVNNGVKTTRKSVLVQVNNQEEQWISKVFIHYNASEDLKYLNAEILDSSGKTVRKLKNKEVETRAYMPDGTFFEDDLYKVFDLAYNVFPYRFKYSYEIDNDNFNHLAYWVPIYRENVKTIEAKLTIDLPASYEYNNHIKDISNKREELISGRKVLTYKSSYLRKIASEKYSASSQELYPHVLSIPENFHYGVDGNSASWESYGDWHIKLNEGLDYLTSSEKAKVDEIIEATPDTLELIKKLYYHLQDHTRYINVAIDIGGLKPYSAAYVCTNKYGDCKALTMYMKALLKYAGINSNYTVINAGDDAERIIEKYPFQQFNHVLLTVPFEGDTLWLENTSDYLPFAYNGTFTQNRKALAVDLKNSQLINSPALSTEDVLSLTKVNFNINDEGTGTLSIDVVLKGELFERYSYLNRHATTKDFNTQVVRDFKIKDSEVVDYKVVDYSRDDFFMNLEINLKVQNQIRTLGSLRVIKPYVIELPELEKPIFRKNDLLIRYPINEQHEIVYSLSANEKYNAELPDDILIETKYGIYKQTNTFNGTQIKINKHFKLFGGEYPQSDYEEFYNFFQSVNKAQKESIILENN
ncbi:DUF3857 domain-containing protein [Fulvivirga lutimaris]|uniref:DUF3857 domain-containing protein n=1 Tax=Fulvivirga lutimaris TaxID=1819566 RepID=UPI0012BC5070|nr:DUF3857 domain-containing protein [Fulvivirga lutimaris]